MSSLSFKHIVKNYENIYKLGKEIIKHKEIVTAVPKSNSHAEFIKQEIRIQEFTDAIDNANKEWNDNEDSINTYWTGLS